MFLYLTKKQGKTPIFQILTFIKTQPSFEKTRIEPTATCKEPIKSFDPAYEPGWIYKRLPNQETRNGSEFTSTIHHIATDENRKIRNRRSYL